MKQTIKVVPKGKQTIRVERKEKQTIKVVPKPPLPIVPKSKKKSPFKKSKFAFYEPR